MLQLIIFSLIGGIFSLAGGLLLLSRKRSAEALAKYATPFAAGALLAAAFLDLLAEALEEAEASQALTWALVGVVGFFFLERVLHWYHHHHVHEDSTVDPSASLIIVGDTLHNALDGVAIAAAFLIDPKVGIITTLAVALHEIPQEIGDFGLLLAKGLSRKTVIIINVISALATTIAAIITFQLGQNNVVPIGALLGLTAGFFIYIAAADIIPDIHEQSDGKKVINLQAILLLAGAVLVGVLTTNLHHQIEDTHHMVAPTEHASSH